MQVNSLGLTEEQPENNAWRILIEALGVTLSRKARCRALQLPTWNEALSLPRPWDQQWSLRLQQILAYETDLLEYPDLFDGSPVVASKVAALADGGARPRSSGSWRWAASRRDRERLHEGGAGALDGRAHGAHRPGEQIVVGVNKWTDGACRRRCVGGDDGGVFKVDDPAAADEALASARGDAGDARPGAGRRRRWRRSRRRPRAATTMMEPSIECALARVTTGEWADTLRGVFGEYRAATGVDGQRLGLDEATGRRALRARIEAFAAKLGPGRACVVGKPGLDGHSNGAEVIAVAARHAGFDVIYAGIRLSPEEIAPTAVEEDVDLIGVSILQRLAPRADPPAARGAGCARRRRHPRGGRRHHPASGDIAELEALGVKKVFTPSDYQLDDVMERIVDVIEARVSDPALDDRWSMPPPRATSARSPALVSLFEDDRAEAAATRRAVLARLDAAGAADRARWSASPARPASGKSTLLGALATRLVDAIRPSAVAVVAVDPSSPLTGGALLGDRTRVRFPPDERRLFFRSQASAAELGGLAPRDLPGRAACSRACSTA